MDSWRYAICLAVTGAVAACSSTIAPVRDSKLLTSIDFAADGTTTRAELLNRFGQPQAQYEHGRVATYPLTSERDRLRRADPGRASYILVLEYRDDGVVSRHSLVGLR
jgi:hypothetical protein